MRIVYFDTETTGTDPKQHAIIQIAGMVVEYGDSLEVVEESSFDIKCRPFNGAKIEQAALNINGVSAEELFSNERMGYKEAYNAFLSESKLGKQKAVLCGYNTAFDLSMTQSMAEMCGDRYFYGKYFWPAIDVASVAATDLVNMRHEFKKFNLSTVAAHYGWNDTSGAHEALFDVRMTRFVYEIFLQNKMKLRSLESIMGENRAKAIDQLINSNFNMPGDAR